VQKGSYCMLLWCLGCTRQLPALPHAYAAASGLAGPPSTVAARRPGSLAQHSVPC
jgi:hypothetical protein